MLTKKQNDLLNQTGASSPLGQLMRRYWIPALLSEEILQPDSPQVRVHILGEELVAFRDTNGRIGLLAEHCPPRGTSLFYPRDDDAPAKLEALVAQQPRIISTRFHAGRSEASFKWKRSTSRPACSRSTTSTRWHCSRSSPRNNAKNIR